MRPATTDAATTTNPTPAGTIAGLNDAFRQSFVNGHVVLTDGVASLAETDRLEILAAVRGFAVFTADNDPHGEHDFGAFEHEGTRYFWKIDYYDRDLKAGSPDPANPAVTARVLTIMRADEY